MSAHAFNVAYVVLAFVFGVIAGWAAVTASKPAEQKFFGRAAVIAVMIGFVYGLVMLWCKR